MVISISLSACVAVGEKKEKGKKKIKGNFLKAISCFKQPAYCANVASYGRMNWGNGRKKKYPPTILLLPQQQITVIRNVFFVKIIVIKTTCKLFFFLSLSLSHTHFQSPSLPLVIQFRVKRKSSSSPSPRPKKRKKKKSGRRRSRWVDTASPWWSGSIFLFLFFFSFPLPCWQDNNTVGLSNRIPIIFFDLNIGRIRRSDSLSE